MNILPYLQAAGSIDKRAEILGEELAQRASEVSHLCNIVPPHYHQIGARVRFRDEHGDSRLGHIIAEGIKKEKIVAVVRGYQGAFHLATDYIPLD